MARCSRRVSRALSEYLSRHLWQSIPSTLSADALDYLENELFKRIVDPEEVAGIFIEPIQGEGGYLPAPAEFLQGCKRICRKHGIMLIADEVQSGMGRTGKWWAVRSRRH